MDRTLLIIDDDEDLVAALGEYLPKFNFKVLSSHQPDAGLKILAKEKVDLVILDVMLPGQDGMQVCKHIRLSSAVPIIMLTARGDIGDRIVGLEVGADDYLTKPFEPRELVARIEAILRRSKTLSTQQTLRFKDLEVDLKSHRVKAYGESLELTAMEFEILVLLASKPGTLFTRDQIMNHLRGWIMTVIHALST
ncbi:MAG: response regulator transcription factor [Bdellovibrionota bacterium]